MFSPAVDFFQFDNDDLENTPWEGFAVVHSTMVRHCSSNFQDSISYLTDSVNDKEMVLRVNSHSAYFFLFHEIY